MKGKYKIPFDPGGNQIDYPAIEYNNSHGSYQNTWVENHEFSDSLELVGYGRGRSSVTFTMRRNNGKTVSVFVSDFCDMVPKMTHGSVAGNFTFVKKGQNYGCKLA